MAFFSFLFVYFSFLLTKSGERDIEAVKNAIRSEFSNGIIEGVINKIKVIKRVMYGRCSFELLRMKVMML
jgi:transposase